jgi:hypothetical protein
MIPGFFNLTNTICRMMALLYIPASIAEMMISGLELVSVSLLQNSFANVISQENGG